MKTYLSCWSPGYHKKDYFDYNLYKLSAYYLKKNYGNANLITDKYGAQFLKDIKFDNIEILLEDLPKETGAIWGLGKIKAYSLIAEKKEPFLHLDHDVFLTKKLSENILKQGIIAQHLEREINDLYALDQFHNELPSLGLMSKHRIKNAANMGIFGGNDFDFIKRYSDESINIALDLGNLKYIRETIFKYSWQPSVLYEQYYMTLMADYENRQITYLYDSELQFETKSQENGYVHIWGAKNGDKKIIAKKVYKTLYYLGLNPQGNPTWKNGELIDIN